MKSSVKYGYCKGDTSAALALVLGKSFGVKKAISFGIIQKTIDLHKVSNDFDSSVLWEIVYGGSILWE